jgi:SanA protein
MTTGALTLVIVFCVLTNEEVLGSADGRLFTSAETVPHEPVGLVLGTSPRLNGGVNPFFLKRIVAATALYKAGKVDKLLVSGDHGTKEYDEPSAMRDALIARGVPSKAIVLDYAGFRTLDSIIRARRIFGVAHCTIVTDDFHLPRALYLAAQSDLDAIGFQTEPLNRNENTWTYVREVGARSLTWIDIHVINRQPRFLGPREPIQGS